MQAPTRLLVPLDLEFIAWEALNYACLLAARTGALTEVLYALPFPERPIGPLSMDGPHDRMITLIASLTTRYSQLDASNHTRENEPVFVGVLQVGAPAELILKFAGLQDHDVIIMGSHREDDQPRVRHTSIAEIVVRSANCPVLVIPDTSTNDRLPVLASL
jgi:nucleotide-binding universal stress UspA family protein